MANRRINDIAEDLAAVVDFVRQSANGARSGEIAEALSMPTENSSFYRLKIPPPFLR